MSTDSAAPATAGDVAADKQSADKAFAKAVDERFLAVADAAGLIKDGRLDKNRLADCAYEILKTRHVVDISAENDDRRDPARSTHKEELAELIFEELPSNSQADGDLLLTKVRDRCLTAVWDVAQTGDRGLVQKRLRPDHLILIRGAVFRDSLTVNTGLYVSTHQEIVVREWLEPRLQKFRNLARDLNADYQMASDRAQELAEPMRELIEAAMVEVTAKLPIATLEPGANGGKKALGK